jgi:aspartate-semialdehyde dehydrogenase
MSRKYRVGILGATGMVGQRFIQLLADHPQFEIGAVAASDRSQGKNYGDACTWRLSGEMPAAVRAMPVQPPTPPLDCDLVFSSLPGEIARETEGSFAAAGYPVISNSSAYRMDEDVPLLIPEVNHTHLGLLERQKAKYPRGGFIVTDPNCSAIMIALALAPLHAACGIEATIITTLQALSGAGYPGVASLDILDNVLPYISGAEEEKIEIETTKILGRCNDSRIEAAPIAISAQCHRVNVVDGHMAAVRVKLARKATLDDVREALASFRSLPQELRLHSAPDAPIVVRDEQDRPQPKLDRDAGNGMTVTVGRLKPDAVFDYRFVALSHNTIRGAAGAAILNAELLIALNHL